MRVLSLLLAAAGVASAQSLVSTSSSAAPSTTATPTGPSTGVRTSHPVFQSFHHRKLSTDCQKQELGDAAVVDNNPVGVAYKATLPETAFFKPAFPNGGNIKGEVVAVANPDGKGVLFTVKLSNLPKIGAALRKSAPSSTTGDASIADPRRSLPPPRGARARRQLHGDAGAPGPLHPRRGDAVRQDGAGDVPGGRPQRQARHHPRGRGRVGDVVRRPVRVDAGGHRRLLWQPQHRRPLPQQDAHHLRQLRQGRGRRQPARAQQHQHHQQKRNHAGADWRRADGLAGRDGAQLHQRRDGCCDGPARGGCGCCGVWCRSRVHALRGQRS